MDVHELNGGAKIYRFDTGPFNWYVVREGGRLTVVDAGFPGHYAILRRGLAELGLDVRDVEAILLTHAHADHMGFMERLRRETRAPVFVHAADKAAAMRSRQLPWAGLLGNAWRPYIAGMLGHAAMNGVFTMPAIDEVRTIEDGQRLDVPGRPVVIHAPGHTEGEVAFHLPEHGVLLAGDVLVTRHLLTGAYGAPQLVPPVLTDDYAQARRSLDRLREMGKTLLLTGHGRAWRGDLGEAVMAAAV